MNKISDFVCKRLLKMNIKIPIHRVSISVVSKERLYRLAGNSDENLLGLTVSEDMFLGMLHHIYIREGLSLFSYIETLSHEFGHVWLNDTRSSLNRSSLAEVEGFCNLLAFKIFQNGTSKKSRKVRERLLNNPDPIYGDGFRMMKKKAERMGLKAFLQLARY